MYVDLHCHSHYSDGAQTPEYLVSAAFERGLSHLALTDHDCLCGIEQLWRNAPNMVDYMGHLTCLDILYSSRYTLSKNNEGQPTGYS